MDMNKKVWIKNNGQLLGPLPLERALQAFQSGKFSSNAQISDNQAQWYSIEDLCQKMEDTSERLTNVSTPMQEPMNPPQNFGGQPMNPNYGGQPMMNPNYGTSSPQMQPPPMNPPQNYGGQPMMNPNYGPSSPQMQPPPMNPPQNYGGQPMMNPNYGPSTSQMQPPPMKPTQNYGGQPMMNQNYGGNMTSPYQGAQNKAQKKISPNGKSASLAVILSCLITGVGQMYLGQIWKGILWLVTAIMLNLLWQYSFEKYATLVSICYQILCMIDAYKIGKKLENGQSVGEWEN